MKYLKTKDGECDMILGQSALENDQLISITKKRDQNSWWFHLESVSSAHLVIFCADPKEYIQEVRELIQKPPWNQRVIYTQVKHVKRQTHQVL